MSGSLNLLFKALLSRRKPASVACAELNERLEVFQDFLHWRFRTSSCWNLQQKLDGGFPLKSCGLTQSGIQISENAEWHSQAINEQMPCVRAGCLLLHTSSRFIHLHLPGSDYPQSLNLTRKLPASSESASLQFIALLPRTHHEIILSVCGWGYCHVTCFTTVWTEAALVFLRGPAEWSVCVLGFIVNPTTYCGRTWSDPPPKTHNINNVGHQTHKLETWLSKVCRVQHHGSLKQIIWSSFKYECCLSMLKSPLTPSPTLFLCQCQEYNSLTKTSIIVVVCEVCRNQLYIQV